MTSKKTDSIVTKVKQLIGDDSLKQKFADIICQQMSNRTIETLAPKELCEFIIILYDFFIIKHNKESHVYLGQPKIVAPSLTNHLILKMSNPDASHLFITLEEIMRKYHLRTTRRLHPIIGIVRNKKGNITDIVSPDQSNERRSLVFVAFDSVVNPSLIPIIKKDIEYHMNAVQLAQEDSSKIFQMINQVSKQLEMIPASTSSEWIRLLKWLNDQNFSFFGGHCIDLSNEKPTVSESYGICLPNSGVKELHNPSDHLLSHSNNENFIVDRTTIISPIQRFEPLMKVSFKFNSLQYIFYGILKRSSMYAKNMDTPIIHKKIRSIFDQRNFLPGSYDYNEVIRIFNDIPKFEILRSTNEDLLEMVDFIMSITNSNHIQCHKKLNTDTNRLVLYFVIPYYLFNVNTVKTITEYICDHVDYSFHEVLPINAPEKCRIHFHFTLNQADTLPNEETIERTLTQLVQPWEDQVLTHITNTDPNLLTSFPNIIEKIPSHYKVRTNPNSALRDVHRLLGLNDEDPILFELFSFDYPKTSELAGKVSMLLVYHRTKLDLTNILPILHNLGIHVIDQITSRFGDSASTIGYIHAFRILDSNQKKLNEELIKDRFIQTVKDIFTGVLPNDPLNALTLKTNLNSEDIFLLQALRNYLYQIFQSSFSIQVVNQCLNDHPSFVQKFIGFFKDKFSSTLTKQKRLSTISKSIEQLTKYIKGVSSITDDQILRRLLSLADACIRTNLFIRQNDMPLSFKFNCSKINGIPTPIPYKETFVFDHILEGVHIRFGEVARGGLRWSDRINDYRTEVLDLVKTQQTKNAVIIPVGSKGGFVIKDKLIASDKDAGVSQYKRFIKSMLQITDNLDKDAGINEDLITYDDFDPYFVVAADKGTATFSDIANDVSLTNKFWLGDGFASGGKNGYDHKKVGITAKGAWECCKLHFNKNDINPEKSEITVAGVGDMSGDVFGNGMLLSKSIKLVAAFNHLHIFIDPNPDPQKSWSERNRLFKLKRSQWTDYQEITAGGGVFDRSAKEIKCSKEMKSLLNITDSIISGEDLVKAILMSSVDLIWFGGIGTYIKSDTETHIDAADPANNSVRINASQLNSSVISEGANLAITQKGRIEFDLNGGQINTDAIDNSAGVNMSDYEVNIKILLSTLQKNGVIKNETSRNKILHDATDEVTDLVLKNNISQHHLITMDQYRSIHQPHLIENTISTLIKDGDLNPHDEQFPLSKARQELYKQKRSLPRPVLAKCQAYTKMKLKIHLTNSTLFSGSIYDQLFYEYFPASIQSLISPAQLPDHRLKQEIIITELTNYFVGIFGCASFDLITCSNQVALDQAIHHLVIIEQLFKLEVKRDECFAQISKPDSLNLILTTNSQVLELILVLSLLNVTLTTESIQDYKKLIKTHKRYSNYLPIFGFLFNQKNPTSIVKKLDQLDRYFNILYTLEQLSQLVTTTKQTQQQKQYLLSDLYYFILDSLKLNANSFQALLKSSDLFQSFSIDFSNPIQQLTLYTFELRQLIKNIR